MSAQSTLDAEQTLMQGIKTKYGGFIDAAVSGTPFPASLLAALVANETGLDPTKKRFEPAVLGQLAQVLVALKPSFGAIGAEDLKRVLPGSTQPGVLRLIGFATSWGPTQIMGYQALAGKYELAELTNLDTHFHHAAEILEDFRQRFMIGQGEQWKLFRCWNAGSPNAKTYDAEYVPNGMQRIQVYEGL